jgi:elongation factor G
MEADVYYDDLGKDMRVEPIPADMVELAEQYRAQLIEAAAEPTRRFLKNTATAKRSRKRSLSRQSVLLQSQTR